MPRDIHFTVALPHQSGTVIGYCCAVGYESTWVCRPANQAHMQGGSSRITTSCTSIREIYSPPIKRKPASHGSRVKFACPIGLIYGCISEVSWINCSGGR